MFRERFDTICKGIPHTRRGRKLVTDLAGIRHDIDTVERRRGDMRRTIEALETDKIALQAEVAVLKGKLDAVEKMLAASSA